MFDIGFGELLLVFVIALVVLGPERLPIAVRTVAGWIRTLRSLASTVQNELAQEMKLQELQESLKKVEQASQLQNLSPELKASMDELKEAAQAIKRPLGIKPDGTELPEHIPLSEPPLGDDRQAETLPVATSAPGEVSDAKRVTLSKSVASHAAGASASQSDEHNVVVQHSAEHKTAEVKANTAQSVAAVSSQPSGDR